MGIQESRLVFEAAFPVFMAYISFCFSSFSLHKPQGIGCSQCCQPPGCNRCTVSGSGPFALTKHSYLGGKASPKTAASGAALSPRTAAVTVGVGVSAGVGLPGAGSSGAGISGGVGGLFWSAAGRR